MTKKRLKINISGDVFETTPNTIMRYPNTLLADTNKRHAFYNETKNEFYFNRSRKCFDAILFFYQSYGRLSCPGDINFDFFVDECRFFCLPEINILKMIETEGLLLQNNNNLFEKDCKSQWQIYKHHVWNVLENPETSLVARIYAIYSLLLITTSVVCLCLETMDEASDESKMHDSHWRYIEFIINILFSIEFIARFIFAPTFISFIKSFSNWLDFFAIFPYYYETFAETNRLGLKLQFLRTVRLIRVVRFFRISKRFQRLLIACEIIRSQIQDLQLVGLCACISIVMSGSLMYQIEKNVVGTKFTSIPVSLWWAVETSTTVGYGEMIPFTLAGKLFAGCYMAIGAVSASIPILSIVTKFARLYSRNLREI